MKPIISVAPMMKRTDRHYRYFMRCISQETILYTEMVTTGALLHGDRERFLKFDPVEHSVICQLGGDDPAALVECAKFVEDCGYDGVNLNIGCPSDRVQSGNFGACLMRDPERVAGCSAAMIAAVDIPVTVKHRIGVDELDRYEDMLNFVDVVAEGGVTHFMVHARKAWLSGLSPKENRNVPPLRYDDVFRLKRERPNLRIEINGGIKTWNQIDECLAEVDGVMIGRAAYDDPMLFADVDHRLFDGAPGPTRFEVAHKMIPYIEREIASGTKLSHITNHMMQLFRGERGGKRWRQLLSEAHQSGAGIDLYRSAIEAVESIQKEQI